MRKTSSIVLLTGMMAMAVFARAVDETPLLNSKPLTPTEEAKTFVVPDGFRVELVASEPTVVDPVCMCFDEGGRIFVCEMRGYPNGGRGTGTISSGRIRMLVDDNHDGVCDRAVTFADNLRFPTGITPWRGGLLVANAPELLYLKDTDGDGVADVRNVLYTGFDVSNIQQLLNSLQFALDNRIHGVAGMAGGTIVSAEKPGAAPVSLRGRGVRFDPDVPGSLEPTSGGGQYGLTADTWGRWFTATNSQHLRHIVLPDHYLRRNTGLVVNAVTLDIPEHGAACKVFRRSPHEAWRVLRTSRRAGGKDANRFASTELVPGGYVTSACSPLVYTVDRFPESYQGSVFVCDPANNLILRDVLVPHGATFVARRGHADSEFLSSTDNWFRPVHLTLGPDGAIYVLDFYREVIETPLSLEDDIKRRVNLQSRERGRIWRITAGPAERRGFQPGFDPKDTDRLVLALNDANSWTRLTAQRLLVERKDRAALPALEKLAATGTSPGRIHALRTLSAFGALRPEQVVTALQDEQPGLREQALQLAEPYLASSESVRRAALALVKDPSPRVRFQLAFSLGELDSAESATTLAEIASRPDSDSWTQTAVLSSASRCASRLLQLLTATDKPSSARLNLLRQVARLVGTTGTDTEIASAFQVMGTFAGNDLSGQLTLLDGLGQGLAASGRPLAPLWDRPPTELAQPVAKARRLFEQARNIARDEQQPLDRRVQAIRLLGRGPFSLLEEIAPALLEPRSAPEVQMAAVRALAEQDRSEVSRRLLDAWSSASPSLRREMAEALLGRRDRVIALLSALESKQVLPAQMDPAVITRLRQYSDPGIRNRMAKLRSGQPDVARAKVVQEYQGALDLPGDVARGKSVFQKHCAACHRLENVGTQVGADLLAGLRNKTPSTLLVDILDPGREVDPRFTTYVVTTTRGQVFSGIIASESATSLTLKRGEGAEDTVLRTQIERTESTGKSLMPEGLEAQISRQNMADLIAYLMKQGASR